MSGIVGVVLAGGLSRRMGGRAKALMPLGGRPMIAYAIDRIRPSADACILNVNGDDTAFAQFGLPIVADAVEGHAGPLAGLLSGIIWAAEHRPDARHIVTAPCDTPFLPDNYVRGLAEAAGGEDGTIAAAASGGRVHFASGLWPVALADDLAAFLESGERRIQSWLERHPNRSVTFPPIEKGGARFDPFFNVNTPEDLSAAETFLWAWHA